MFEDLLKDVLPDHEDGFNLGDWMLMGFTIVLAVFTAFRSFDFITKTLPEGWELIGYVGLFVLDGGFLIWAYAIATAATTPKQAFLAWLMWVLDGLGLAAVVLADTFLYTSPGASAEALAAMVSTLAAWAFPLMAIVNAAGAILFKMDDPGLRLRRVLRAKKTQLMYQKQLGELQATLERLQALVASEIIRVRSEMADLKKALTEKKMELDALERELKMRQLAAIAGANGKHKGASPQREAPTHQAPITAQGHYTATSGNEHGPGPFGGDGDFEGLDPRAM